MATAGSINIFVNANTKNFDKGIKNVQTGIRGLTKGFADIAGGLFVAQQAFNAGANAVGMFTARIERLDSIADMSERLNVSADSLQVLQRAAVIAGGDIESLNKSLTIFQRTLGDAASGASGPSGALDKLNLSAQELVNLKLDEAFKLVITRLEAMPTATERAAVAADLFGRSSGMLAELLEHGSSALQQAGKDVDMFAAKLDGNLESINKSQTAVERLSLAWNGLWDSLAIGTATKVMGTFDRLKSQGQTIKGWFEPISDMFGFMWRMDRDQPFGDKINFAAQVARDHAARFEGMQMFPAEPTPVAPAIPGISPRTTGQFHSLQSEWQHLLNEGLSLNAVSGAASPGLSFAEGPSNFAFLRRMLGVDPVLTGGAGAAGRAGAVEFGSAAGFAAIQARRNEDESRRLMKQEVDETRKVNQNLEKILQAGALAIAVADLQ